MKHKLQINVSQTSHPIVGFGWYTGTRIQNKQPVISDRSYNVKMTSPDKRI